MPYSSWTINHLNPPWKRILFGRIRADLTAAAAAAEAAATARPDPSALPILEEEPIREAEANPVPDPAPASEPEPTCVAPEERALEPSEEYDDIPPPEFYCLHTDDPLWGLDLIYEPATCKDFFSHNITHITNVMAKTAKLKRLAQCKAFSCPPSPKVLATNLHD